MSRLGNSCFSLLATLSATIAVSALMLTNGAIAAEHQDIRVQRFTSFNTQSINFDKKHATATSGSSLSQHTQVNVYGTQLKLALQDNQQLLESLPANRYRTQLLRGQLEGNDKSWVRLTHADDGTHGLIWDGSELYVIEPGDSVISALATTAGTPSSETVIFRLSDTTVDLGAEYCGSEAQSANAEVSSGLATYQALSAELSSQVSSTHTPTLRLELLALADAAFRAQYSSDQAALDAIMVRMNNIDGIFSTQLGLQVQATDVQIYGSDPAALGHSTDAGTLLSALGQLRNNSPVMSSYAVTHLFTGRDLDGDTLGIAYIGNVCNSRYGVSLSEVRNRGAWIDSLVAAHELGHQLGAVHDGSGACASTATQDYLMSAQINGNSSFSQCSQASILATLQYASCLVPVGMPDITIASAPLTVAPGITLKWLLPIRNVGTSTARLPSIHISLPADLIVESSSIPGGSCLNTNSNIDCQFDELAANETRQLEINLLSKNQGTYTLNAEVAVADDANTSNDHANFSLAVSISSNAQIAPTANATTDNATTAAGGGGSFSAGWLCLLLLGAARRHYYN